MEFQLYFPDSSNPSIVFVDRSSSTTLLTVPSTGEPVVVRFVWNGTIWKLVETVVSQDTGYSGYRNLIGIVDALSSGSGTLSGVPTVNDSTSLNTIVDFLVSGIPNKWFLDIGQDATGPGVQRPDDWNTSTNAVVWRQIG